MLETIGEDKCSIIKSDTKSNELMSIINDNCFLRKVLICTKAMDNGINIKDDLVKNIVVLAWDKISLLQMIGRKRINIDDAQEINLYISTRSKKAFQGLLRKYKKKQADIDLLILKDDNKNSFNKKYDNGLSRISDDIIYKDAVTNEFMVNPIGEVRLKKDTKFAEYMIKQFEENDEFSFIREQLEWLGLIDIFDEFDLIEDVVLNSDIETLENYLDSISDKKLFIKEQQELSDIVIKELTTIGNNIDYRTKILKPSTVENIIRNELGLEYAVSKSKKETKGEMKDKRYIIISKIIKEI